MNNKGFTILELIISLAILSIATVFMLTTIMSLKDTEEANGVDTKALLNQAIISSTINADINKYGLDSVETNTDFDSNSDIQSSNVLEGKKIIFKFLNDSTKELVLYNIEDSKTTSIYYGKDYQTVDFKRTLPDGFYFKKTEISTKTFQGKYKYYKITIPLTNEKHNYDIEIYYYPNNDIRDSLD